MDTMEKEFKEVKDRTRRLEMRIENDVVPSLNDISKCYLDTYKRYVKEVDKVDGLLDKVAVIEITVEKHSEQIVSLQHRFA